MAQKISYDVIVIGGGHAGTEAAMSAARMGAKTLLLTQNVETIGQMSCNPAIGGIGKGHIVKEVDALGGVMATAIDHAGIQFRTLNARKGPAVRATRAQADRVLYRQAVRRLVENQENLSIFQQAVSDLVIDAGVVTGAVTEMGLVFSGRRVILTTGTFLGGVIHIGENSSLGGRAGDPPSNALARRLRERPFTVNRLKTGTPPRIDGRSIDFSAMEEQPGDVPVPVFSFLGSPEQHPEQISCHITYTNRQTHDIIRGGLDRSPIYTGVIEGVGPRYCPSIEDKVVRFEERDSHQIFLEPEGLDTHEVYPNGISTSLPFDIQQELVHSISGLEKAQITRPGYAIEYDFFDPRELRPTLETRHVDGLFFAGQINGTTGYEEAAGQGLLAGINAALQVRGHDEWHPTRDRAYIGVLVDDLVTRGTNEPYRMFTSRAEYRLLLREDNADLRLTEIAHELGLISERRWRAFSEKREAVEKEQQRLKSTWLSPSRLSDKEATRVLGQALKKESNLLDLLRRPEISYDALMGLPGAGPGLLDGVAAAQVEIQAKYQGYIDRQTIEIARQRRHEGARLPDDIVYALVPGLSTEVSLKLEQYRPATLGQASRISGITPVAISLLMVHLKKRTMVSAA